MLCFADDGKKKPVKSRNRMVKSKGSSSSCLEKIAIESQQAGVHIVDDRSAASTSSSDVGVVSMDVDSALTQNVGATMSTTSSEAEQLKRFPRFYKPPNLKTLTGSSENLSDSNSSQPLFSSEEEDVI